MPRRCHNAIWEHTAKLLENGINPDKRSHEAIAAELTNHLIESNVLTPGMAGTIPQLQQAGFHLREVNRTMRVGYLWLL
jgi:hypothetical protein